MPTAKELATQIRSLIDESKRLKASAEAEGRNLTEAEDERLTAIASEIEDLNSQVDAINAREDRDAKIAAAEKRLKTPRSLGIDLGKPGGETQIEVGEPGWKKDPSKGFKDHRDFLRAVMGAGSRPTDERLVFLRKASAGFNATAGSDEQSTFHDAYGGYLVPVGIMGGLLTVSAEADPTAGLVLNIPMEAPEVRMNARVDKSHSTSVSGGLRVYRREEAGTVTASKMEFEQVALKASPLMGISHATEEVLADSPASFIAMLQAGFGDEFAAKIIDEKLNGTGVGTMEGVIAAPGTVTVSAESGQTAATINATNVNKMRARCWRYGQAVWLANHDTIPSLFELNQGVETAPMWQPSLREDHPDTLLGRPIIFTEYCQTLGTKGDLVLGNWSQYLVGTYQPLSSAESMHVRFSEHERAFKFFMRNDGRCWWRAALTPKKSAATLSPFVVLATRA